MPSQKNGRRLKSLEPFRTLQQQATNNKAPWKILGLGLPNDKIAWRLRVGSAVAAEFGESKYRSKQPPSVCSSILSRALSTGSGKSVVQVICLESPEDWPRPANIWTAVQENFLMRTFPRRHKKSRLGTAQISPGRQWVIVTFPSPKGNELKILLDLDFGTIHRFPRPAYTPANHRCLRAAKKHFYCKTSMFFGVMLTNLCAGHSLAQPTL